jgi:hypothetical protein
LVLNDDPPFDSLAVNGNASPAAFTGGSGSWTITAQAPSVPEPSSAILLATLCAAAFLARKRLCPAAWKSLK